MAGRKVGRQSASCRTRADRDGSRGDLGARNARRRRRHWPLPTGHRHGYASWLLRITVDQWRREFGLGAFPTVTVLAARNAARSLREKIGHGADPALQRRAARAARQVPTSKTVTFKACTEAFLAAELASGRDARYVGVARSAAASPSSFFLFCLPL